MPKHDSPTTARPAGSPPPPRVDRYAGGRRLMLVTAGALFAIALLVVLMNVQWGSGEDVADRDRTLDDAITTFDPPDRMTEEELANARSAGSADDPEISMTSGARIEVWGEDDRMVQEYVAARIQPRGQGRIELADPQAWFYLDESETLLLEGDLANARRRTDNNMLEGGTITGHVVVRLFSREDGTRPDTDRDTPTVVIHTAEAIFDQVRGEIRCPGWVDVQTTDMHFKGEDLTAFFTPENGLQRLTVERSTDRIRIAQGAYENSPLFPSFDRSGGEGEDRTPAHTNDPLAMPQDGTTPSPTAGRSATQPIDGNRMVITRLQDPPDDTEARRREARDRRREGPQASRPEFYRAVLHENVIITREGTDEVITGDDLHLVFSLKNTSMSGETAHRRQRSLNVADFVARAPARRARDVLLAAAIGSLQDAPAAPAIDPERPIVHRIMPAVQDGDVYIAYRGRLVVSPILDETEHLASTDDLAMRLYGSPVSIDDPTNRMHATAATLEYTSADERLALLASPATPVHFANPEIAATGQRFDYWLHERRGAFDGSGAMHLAGRTADAAREHTPELQPGQDAGGGTEQDLDATDDGTPLDIAWTSGVELIFAPPRESQGDGDDAPETEQGGTSDGGRIERAIFRGDVVVTEEAFRMNSDTLEVAFDTESDRDDAISQIIGNGNVVVHDLGERGGYMEGDFLQVDFAFVPEEEESLPHTVYARGDTLVRDNTQSVRSNELTVTLVPAVEEDDPGDTTTRERRSPGAFDRMQIDTFLAVDDVFVELDNGITATGDRLDGHAIEGTADLTGREVVVIGTKDDVDFRTAGTHARIDRLDDGRSRIRLDGEGRAQLRNLSKNKPQGETAAPETDSDDDAGNESSNDPADTAGDEDAANQEIGDEEVQGDAGPLSSDDPLRDPEQVDITWRDQFMYIEGAEEASGTMDVRGDVVAVSRAPREENRLTSQILSIDFAEEQTDPIVDSAGNVTQETNRVMRNLVARGNAVIESRTWETEARTDEPRLVHIKGQHVAYNQQTLEADVLGAGQLLIHDPRPVRAEAEAELAGSGTSLFEWTREMHMKQFVDDRYDVSMRGTVEMRHRSARGIEHNSTIAAEELDVSLSRRESTERKPGLDFGGSTDIERFEARGGDEAPLVSIDAQQKRITCHEFVYNTRENIAQIIGTDRVPAEVRTERQSVPMRATAMVWDLSRDTLNITDIRTTIPRRPGGGGG